MSYNPYFQEKFTKNDYLRAFIWGIVFTALAYIFQAYRNPNREFFTAISNAFLIGGGIQLVRAGFSYINREGFFDVGIVGFKQLGSSINSSLRGRSKMDYKPDLKSYREEKIKTRRVNMPYLVSGTVLFLISVITAFL